MADEDADHYDDIKKGIAAIKSLIESEDTNSKNVRMKALRADLDKAISPDALKDLTSASLAKFKTAAGRWPLASGARRTTTSGRPRVW